MNLPISMRYDFTVTKHNREDEKRPLILMLLPVVLPIAGLALLATGLKLSGANFSISSMYRLAILPLFFVGVLSVLSRMHYRGSYIPFVALILLMGLGLVMQTRLGVKKTDTSIQIQNVIALENGKMLQGRSENNTARQAPFMTSDTLAFIISLVSFVAVIWLFSGKILDWAGQKYMLVFTFTIVALAFLVIVSQLIFGGKFFYSMIPWELCKISLPIALAGFLADNGRFLHVHEHGKISMKLSNWGPFLLFISLPMILFVVLGDYGQLMIYGALILIMLFVATGSLVYPVFAGVGLLIVPLIVSIILPIFPDHVAVRWDLWQHFWSGFPSSVWWDRSYQTANAIFALNAGGLGGTGLGLGSPGLVPLSQSDFIFVEVAEELGFIGTLAIFLLYLSIIVTGFRTASHCVKRFDFLVVSAISLTFCCQIFINIGGVINFVPLTGIVLPFLSKGGFSLITFTILVGLIMAVSHKNAINQKIIQ